jgi:hypothetical protein
MPASGMPLTTAERLASIAGPRTAFLRHLVERLKDWPTNIKLANDRARRFQVVGHFVRAISSLPSKITKPSSLSLEKWLREDAGVQDEDGITEDINLFITIVQHYSHITFHNAITEVLAPVEFIYAAVLIHLYKHHLSLDQLAEGIRGMRERVRTEHVDIRTNSVVCETLRWFVAGWMKRRISTNSSGILPSTKRMHAFEGIEPGVAYALGCDDGSSDSSMHPRKKRRVESEGMHASNLNHLSSTPPTPYYSPSSP